jgi:hypothetical protein
MNDEKPAVVYTDVYGRRPPAAAEFGKGATDLGGIKEATDGRRDQRPGDAEK